MVNAKMLTKWYGRSSEKLFRKQDSKASWNLGGNIYITASKEYPLLDLRHYWKPDPNVEF